MTGLNLTGKSSMVDWLRKNEPRGDRFHDDMTYKTTWYYDTVTHKDPVTLQPTTTELIIVKGIDIIIEVKNGETIPVISASTQGDLLIWFPLTQGVLVPVMKSITLDCKTHGLNAILQACEPSSLKVTDMSGITGGARYISGFINLNNIILDSGISGDAKYLKIEGKLGNDLEISGTGRIIFRINGWKIIRSDW